MASAATIITNKPIEDPLDHLPCSCMTFYHKGQTIYGQGQPTTPSIYLIIDGKVKVSRLAEDGREVLVDIYRVDDLFGESVFLNLARRSEQAIALENTKAMSWTTDEIETLMNTRPALVTALMQLLSRRILDLTDRVEKSSLHGIPGRLAHMLIRFSERIGTEEPDGSVTMMPFTHQLLSQYVGTSREIITYYLNRFRREGFLKYSRRRMSLQPHACQEWLRLQKRRRGPEAVL